MTETLNFGDYVQCVGNVLVYSDGRKFVEVTKASVVIHRKEFALNSIVVNLNNGEIGKIVAFREQYPRVFVSYDRGKWLGCSSTGESFLDIRMATDSEVARYNKECAEKDERTAREKIADVATETLLAELADRLKTITTK